MSMNTNDQATKAVEWMVEKLAEAKANGYWLDKVSSFSMLGNGPGVVDRCGHLRRSPDHKWVHDRLSPCGQGLLSPPLRCTAPESCASVWRLSVRAAPGRSPRRTHGQRVHRRHRRRRRACLLSFAQTATGSGFVTMAAAIAVVGFLWVRGRTWER